jgi:NAD(P)-dependent dehydrogenase (short-subunit alcohol dehydrogenase family)
MTSEARSSAPVIIVTGASGNLGGAVITRLVATGARVVAVERARVRYGDDVLAPIDLGRAELVQSAFASVAERLGGLDGIVHTVGVYQGGRSLLDTTTEDFTSLFQTNVVATANILHAALAVMLPQRRGQIAVVASADALSGAASRSAYSASKGAQLRVVESAAEEVRGRGITLNAVLPGTMDTPQNRAAQPTADRSSWLSLDAVAQVLVYLVSPSAAAIHGEAIRLGRSPAQ